MPDFPIIDAHVHLWDRERYRVPWLDAVPAISGRHELAEYREQTRGIEIEAFVYLEIDIAKEYALVEPRQVETYAREDPRLRGTVAYAPVEYGDQVRPYLEELVAVGPRVKGVRRLLQGERDAEFCLQPGFVRGVELLSDFGLSFDICIVHHQLPAATELVRRLPGVRFVLDHIGKPAIRDGELEPWRTRLTELAALPNVHCKLSGVVTEANHESWQPESIKPYVRHVLEAFGEDRVLFASDWPVVTLASSYRRWVETVESLTTDLSPDARRKLWAENARQFYRLGE